MMVGGWKTRSIFERCNIKSEDDLRDAAELVATSSGVRVAASSSGLPFSESLAASTASGFRCWKSLGFTFALLPPRVGAQGIERKLLVEDLVGRFRARDR